MTFVNFLEDKLVFIEVLSLLFIVEVAAWIPFSPCGFDGLHVFSSFIRLDVMGKGKHP